jgi:hypothetical protein
MKIRRAIIALVAASAMALAGASAASAAPGGNPHFIGNATSASLSGTSLIVKFKEAGLPSGAVETITASAHLDATYSCVNNGGKVPADPKKTTISSDLSVSGTFTAGNNGQVVGSLTISTPAASSVLDCPPGQTATLESGTYSNVSVSDATSGAFLAISGTFSF